MAEREAESDGERSGEGDLMSESCNIIRLGCRKEEWKGGGLCSVLDSLVAPSHVRHEPELLQAAAAEQAHMGQAPGHTSHWELALHEWSLYTGNSGTYVQDVCHTAFPCVLQPQPSHTVYDLT